MTAQDLPKTLSQFRVNFHTECVQDALKAFEDMSVLASRTRDFLNNHCNDSMAQILEWCLSNSLPEGNQALDESLNGALELVDRLSVDLAAFNRWTRLEEPLRRNLGEKIVHWQQWCDKAVHDIRRHYVERADLPRTASRALQVADAAAFRDAREISEMVLCATLEFVSLFPSLSRNYR